MNDLFDPYYKWLGIPKHEQPPNHYRLLGVEIFEQDPDVIDSAGEQRIAFLRTLQNGRNGDASQKLLTEVSKALVCLLNSDKKRTYDAELRSQMSQGENRLAHGDFSQRDSVVEPPPVPPAMTVGDNLGRPSLPPKATSTEMVTKSAQHVATAATSPPQPPSLFARPRSSRKKRGVLPAIFSIFIFGLLGVGFALLINRLNEVTDQVQPEPEIKIVVKNRPQATQPKKRTPRKTNPKPKQTRKTQNKNFAKKTEKPKPNKTKVKPEKTSPENKTPSNKGALPKSDEKGFAVFKIRITNCTNGRYINCGTSAVRVTLLDSEGMPIWRSGLKSLEWFRTKNGQLTLNPNKVGVFEVLVEASGAIRELCGLSEVEVFDANDTNIALGCHVVTNSQHPDIYGRSRETCRSADKVVDGEYDDNRVLNGHNIWLADFSKTGWLRIELTKKNSGLWQKASHQLISESKTPWDPQRKKSRKIPTKCYMAFDEYISSPNEMFHLRFLKDGNLVVVQGKNPEDVSSVIWKLGTQKKYATSVCSLEMDRHGKLIVCECHRVNSTNNIQELKKFGPIEKTGQYRMELTNDGDIQIIREEKEDDYLIFELATVSEKNLYPLTDSSTQESSITESSATIFGNRKWVEGKILSANKMSGINLQLSKNGELDVKFLAKIDRVRGVVNHLYWFELLDNDGKSLWNSQIKEVKMIPKSKIKGTIKVSVPQERIVEGKYRNITAEQALKVAKFRVYFLESLNKSDSAILKRQRDNYEKGIDNRTSPIVSSGISGTFTIPDK